MYILDSYRSFLEVGRINSYLILRFSVTRYKKGQLISFRVYYWSKEVFTKGFLEKVLVSTMISCYHNYYYLMDFLTDIGNHGDGL